MTAKVEDLALTDLDAPTAMIAKLPGPLSSN